MTLHIIKINLFAIKYRKHFIMNAEAKTCEMIKHLFILLMESSGDSQLSQYLSAARGSWIDTCFSSLKGFSEVDSVTSVSKSQNPKSHKPSLGKLNWFLKKQNLMCSAAIVLPVRAVLFWLILSWNIAKETLRPRSRALAMIRPWSCPQLSLYHSSAGPALLAAPVISLGPSLKT